MRLIFLFLALCGTVWPQALTEAAAAAAGGSVGGVAGKKVGDDVGTILQKVGQTMEKAADTKEAKAPPALEVGPGVPKTDRAPSRSSSQPPAKSSRTTDRSLVPPPPPIARKTSAAAAVPVVQPVLVLTAAPPPPPPPEVTPADLKTLTNGMGRLAVLKLGPPASRVTMVDAGHFLEIYRY